MDHNSLHEQVEKTILSIEGIRRAEANPFLLTRVLEQLKQPVKNFIRPRVIWQVGASLVLVLGLNIAIGIYTYQQRHTQVKGQESGYFNNHIYTY